MPLYEYECQQCHERLEVLQPVGADGDDLECPACGQAGPEKVLSTFACGDAAASTGGGPSGSGFT